MNKVASLLSIILLAIIITLPVSAAGELVVDDANLLSNEEEVALSNQLSAIQSQYGLDIVVMTINTTDGKSLMEYADDYYDHNGYSADGAILVVNMDSANGGANRAYWLSTAGRGIEVFTDYGIEEIGDIIRPSLSEGNYAQAFLDFAAAANDFTYQAINEGRPYDIDNTYDAPRQPHWLLWIVIAIVIGALLGLIVTSVQKAKHKTIAAKVDATSYIVPGSLHLTDSSDTFLYTSVTSVPIPKDEDHSGGGSSIHTSSAGVPHGGGGGRF